MGDNAYRLTLSLTLAGVHDVFHVSMLRKYMTDESHELDFSDLKVSPDLSTPEWPIRIVDQQECVLQNRSIPFMKGAWQHHLGNDAT